MRTNIVIDDDLMDEALKVSKFKTKKDAVEEGLRLLVQRKKQENVKNLRGKLRWSGDLEQLRTDHK
jgi:Arc/MetJ family transcription regulator